MLGANLVLIYLFVPETFWDRTPRPKSAAPSLFERASSSIFRKSKTAKSSRSKMSGVEVAAPANLETVPAATAPASPDAKPHGEKNVMFADQEVQSPVEDEEQEAKPVREIYQLDTEKTSRESLDRYVRTAAQEEIERVSPPATTDVKQDPESHNVPAKPFKETLKVYNGKIQNVSWAKAAFRPLVLFAYPAVLWSTVVYSFSIGWLIVLSESMSHIYGANPYNFSSISMGLVYISPFVGGILGTVVAGRVSDLIVKFMTKRNGGIYEPEFRLVMAIPVAISTAIGLMGFGWSAEEENSWIVPTVFFGVISFGCSLGSTTAITFCVDSYRQYAGEALVTLNFSKSKRSAPSP